MRARFVAVVVASLWADALGAQARLAFTPVPRTVPISRLEAPMVYDSANQRVVVFMGYDHNYNRYAEVWEYYPAFAFWQNVTPPFTSPHPVPRSGSTAAYDPVRGRALLFGGLTDARTHLGDTWEWDCNARTWLQTATGGTPGVNKPVPREGAGMTYDPGGDRILLFGGVDATSFYKDLWSYNSVAHTWSKLTTTEASASGRVLRPRAFHGLTMVQPGNRLFAFAGEGVDGIESPPAIFSAFEDLWELIGTTWTDRTPSPPAAGSLFGRCLDPNVCPGKGGWRAFGFDPIGNRLITQGGFPAAGPDAKISKTWALSLSTGAWSIVTDFVGSVSLSFRDSHAIVWDSGRNQFVLFGGYLSDLWQLAGAGATWTSPPAFNPLGSTVPYSYPRQDRHAMTFDSLRSRILAVSAGAPEVWALQPTTFVWSVPSAFPGGISSSNHPLDRVDHAIAYDSTADRLLLVGGRCKVYGVFAAPAGFPGDLCGPSGTLYNDVWSFNPNTNTWTQPSISGGPPSPRWEHTLVYDPDHQKFLLFGGLNAAAAPLADTTWILTCNASHSACTWTAGSGGPSARWGQAMAWEPTTHRVVLFGGHNGSTSLADVWSWNGATNAWGGVVPVGTPPSARHHAALGAADALLQGLLLFGGRDVSGPRSDAWLLAGAGGASPQWQSVVVTGYTPAARENPEAAFVPSFNRVVLLGGFDDNGLLPGDILLGTFQAKGDMDRSGSTDLVLKSPSTAQPVIWTMSDATRLAETNVSSALGTNEQVVGVDDFNYDGRNDLVVWNSASSAVNFWLMASTNTVSTSVPLGGGPLPSTDWRVAATADFNHDSKPDLLLRNVATQKLAIWALSGTTLGGAYAPTPDQAIDSNWEVVGALDYNADSNTDLLWYNPTSGKIVFWYLDYNAVRITGVFANPANAGDNNWRVLAAGDYGTTAGGPVGTRDIVWRNATSGRFVVWFMDNAANRLPGGGTFTTPNEPSPTPTAWTIVGPR